jgi:integrase
MQKGSSMDRLGSCAPVAKLARRPWNKGLSDLRVRALTKDEATQIFNYLLDKEEFRNLALFAIAYDGAARGCELVTLKTEDLWSGGKLKKNLRISNRPLHLGPRSRVALIAYLTIVPRRTEWLFGGRKSDGAPLTARQYARLFGEWCQGAEILDPLATESLRRSKAQTLLDETGEIDAVCQLMGFVDAKEVTRLLDIIPCGDLAAALRLADL